MALRRVGLGARRSTVRLAIGGCEQLDETLAGVAHHEIGAAVAQGAALALASDSDHQAKAAAEAGLHARLSVLYDGRLGWLNAKAGALLRGTRRSGLPGRCSRRAIRTRRGTAEELNPIAIAFTFR